MHFNLRTIARRFYQPHRNIPRNGRETAHLACRDPNPGFGSLQMHITSTSKTQGSGWQRVLTSRPVSKFADGSRLWLETVTAKCAGTSWQKHKDEKPPRENPPVDSDRSVDPSDIQSFRFTCTALDIRMVRYAPAGTAVRAYGVRYDYEAWARGARDARAVPRTSQLCLPLRWSSARGVTRKWQPEWHR